MLHNSDQERRGEPIDFDHHRSTAEVDQDAVLADLRQKCPVGWTEAHGGFWVVTKHADVDRVYKDWKTFSSSDGLVIPPTPYGHTPLADDDPPEQTQIRRVLNPLMSESVVETTLLPRLVYWTDLFIDRVIEKGHCDLIADLAVAVPAAVILEWLGWEETRDWWAIGHAFAEVVGRTTDDPVRVEATKTIEWFGGLARAAIEERR
jgi:cytochrome P450